MQVKSLELSGFKSFVDKTKLMFQPGITALVGPNGCGKSNVVDAMRWIMGEHNARHLRGSKMEDLIFSGSDTRRATGMAEVSMIMNTNGSSNGNGNGSTASHEIMVTRRLYRSGESEFFINKIPCRMKDIIELFLDSGVGSKSYSIMEQGKVDFILSLKPDERRILIEEAAGISKYRSRKKEALSKIQSTRSNLNRLQDVLNEIHIQMRGLDLQVKRLKRYKNIKNEIRDIDLLLAAHRNQDFNTQKENIGRSLEGFKDDGMRIASEINRCEADIERTKLKLVETRREVAQYQQNTFSLKNSIQQTESGIQLNESSMQNTRDFITKCDKDISDLSRLLVNTNQNIESLMHEKSHLESEIQRLENDFSKSHDSLNVSRENLVQLQNTIAAENTALLNTVYGKTEVKNAVSLNERLCEEITAKQSKTEEHIRVASQKLTELQVSFASIEEQQRRIADKLRDTDHEIANLSESRNELSAALVEKNDTIQSVRDALSDFNARLSTLRELKSSFEGFGEGVKSVMNADIDGIICLLTDSISTSPEYETAVEAALDRLVQSVIAQDIDHCVKAVELLRHSGSGRISCIPASMPLSDCEIRSIPHSTPLRDVISVQPGYINICSTLFNNMYLIESLQQALKLRHSGFTSATFITPEGDVVTPSGIVTGGSTATAGSGILKRNREIREYTEKLETLQSEMAEHLDQKQRLENQLEEIQHRLHTSEQHRKDLDLERVQVQSRRDQTERSILQEQECKTVLENECQELAGTIEQQRLEHETLEQKLSELSAEEHRLKSRVEELQSKEASLKASLEQSEESHTDLRVTLASFKQKHESTTVSLEKQLDEKNAAQNKIAEMRQEQENLHEKIDRLSRDISSAREKLKKHIEDCGSSEKLLETSENEARNLEEIIETRESSLRDLRHSQDELEPRLHESQMLLSNLAVRTEHLEKELIEKYSLCMADLPEPPEPASFDVDEMEIRLEKLKKRLENIGEVNLGAAREHEELEKRLEYLRAQETDLESSIESLQKVIAKINRITKQKFLETYTSINNHFKELFPLLFNGGKAYMMLTDEHDLLETGIEIYSQPPGKKLQNLDLLSGGERALTVIALMFSIFLTKPSPFCLMDEIDAPLDDSNISRFVDHLKKMAERSQFIMVTHNKLSMQAANSLYGITMEEKGVSKIVSVSLN